MILAGALSVSMLTGCSQGGDSGNSKQESNSKSKEVKKIGITQLVEHPALDATKAGFVKALEKNGFKDGENIDIDFQMLKMICLLHKVLQVNLHLTRKI